MSGCLICFMSTEKSLSNNSILQSAYLRPLLIISVILIGFGGWSIYNHYHNSKVSLFPYTSKKYNFNLSFPMPPAVKVSSEKISGSTASYTTYDSSVNNGNQTYDAYILTYPSQFNLSNYPQKKLVTLLSVEVDTAVRLVLKAAELNSSQSTFLGLPSTQAEFSDSNSATSQTGYIRGFFKGQNEYLIYTIGASKSNFNDFVNSFKFN